MISTKEVKSKAAVIRYIIVTLNKLILLTT